MRFKTQRTVGKSKRFGSSWNNIPLLWACIMIWPIFGLMIEPEPVMAASLAVVLVSGAVLLAAPWIRLTRQQRRRFLWLGYSGLGVASAILTLATGRPYSHGLFWLFVAAISMAHISFAISKESAAFRKRLCPHCRYL